MCRSIKPLFNFDPPATPAEIQGASEQFVKKISGFNKPSPVNQAAHDQAVKEISRISQQLLDSLTTNAQSKNREIETQKAHQRALKRFGKN